jgi:hypothetical protein
MRCSNDGSSSLVTPNCDAALRRIRRKDRCLSVWVDAISINQVDLEERNSQVSMMWDIYASAVFTLVCLDQGDSDSDVALKFVRRAAFFYEHLHLRDMLPKRSVFSYHMLGTGM